jgi:anti-sigma factor ChrR (cupin superfamily)
MNCPLESQEGSAQLLAYTAGKLDGRIRLALASHVESCAGCREFVRGQNAVWGALDLWEAAPVSADFDRRLYQRIAQQVSWWDMLLAPLRPAYRHALPVAAAAGVVLMAVALMGRPSAPAASPAPTSQVETLQPDQVEHALAEVEMLDQFNHLMRSDSPDTTPKM